MNDEVQEVHDGARYSPPDWLTEVLGSIQANPSFLRKCEEAAQTALSIEKMRREREKVGFVAITFPSFVEGLAKLAGVPLRPVLDFYRVPESVTIGSVTAGAAAALARALGFAARETMALLRISLADQHGAVPIQLLAAYRRPTGGSGVGDPLDQCERALGQAESVYPADIQAELRFIQAAVAAQYEH